MIMEVDSFLLLNVINMWVRQEYNNPNSSQDFIFITSMDSFNQILVKELYL